MFGIDVTEVNVVKKSGTHFEFQRTCDRSLYHILQDKQFDCDYSDLTEECDFVLIRLLGIRTEDNYYY